MPNNLSMIASFLSGDHPASQSLFEARSFLALVLEEGVLVALARGFSGVVVVDPDRAFLVGDGQGEGGSEGV